MQAVNFGIDLGTTNSLIAKYENGQVVIYKNPVGHKESLPSVVAFRNERILVGDKARDYLQKDAVNVFSNFKRRMGTDERFYVVNIDDNITPVQLSGYVLKELQQFIYSGEKPEAVVITIPASFDTMQSNATTKAGLEAGFSQVFLLQEPIAASLAYFNSNTQEDTSGYWMVYDLGGGTFDVALVKISDGEMKIVDHEGNNFLGGVDFDTLILEKIVLPQVIDQTGVYNFDVLLKTPYGPYEKLYYQLLYQCEEAKKELSGSTGTDIEFRANIEGVQYDFILPVQQEDFNRLISEKVAETIMMVKQIISRNRLQAGDIRQCILVGGSTYIPYVRSQLEKETGITVNSSIDPTTAVAVGAAYYAGNKYFKSKNLSHSEAYNETKVDAFLEQILEEESASTGADALQIDISYSSMSKEEEEVLLVKVKGDTEGFFYRIVRSDGGFDTGLTRLKPKFTEFLALLPQLNNLFMLRIFDAQGNEQKSLAQEIQITHGQFNIAGQPLPKDICIEVDDKENNTTRLELIFEKNSILPSKKTIYREISKTIQKGQDDTIIINILEGDRYARPLSNLTIGCIEISGRDLESDLIKGSDIELQLSISDNRELTTEVYLVMTQQVFKNVFSISEKHISIPRLKEQFLNLESEIRDTLKLFSYTNNDTWATQTQQLLDRLLLCKPDLFSIADNDTSDKRYIIAETVNRLSQEYDKIGGNERLEGLQEEYLSAKEFVEQHLPMADFDKEKLLAQFQKILQGESQLLRTRNPSILIKGIEKVNELGWNILYNTLSYLLGRYEQIKSYEEADFSNYHAAQSIFKIADKAIENERYYEFRQHFYNLTHLIKSDSSYKPNIDFKGTGIG